MENGNELERLEQFVDKLLGKYNSLKKEYADLEATFWELQGEFDNLNAETTGLRAERAVVGERVAGLISRIELWESEQGSNQGQDSQTTSHEEFGHAAGSQAGEGGAP